MLTTLLALGAALAQEPAPDQNSYYVGGRGGVSIPINSKGLAFPVSVEAGTQFPTNLSLGMRLTFQSDPPEVLGRESPPWALGPVVDVRYFYPTSPNIDIYGDVGFGFLFGVSERDGSNMVMPVATTGVGARLTPGSAPIYVAPEVGVTNFIIPYMGVAVGYVKKAPPKPKS